MNFTRIRLLGLTTIDLPLIGARPSDTYLLKAADGLGPPEATVSVTKGLYQGRQLPDRQIVLRVGLNPSYKLNQRVGDLRNTLYGLLTPEDGDAVPIELYDRDTMIARATGYVSKIEIVPFSQTPEVQIVLDCDSPYLLHPTEIIFNSEGSSGRLTVPNPGNAPTGFSVEVLFTDPYNIWSITRKQQRMTFSMDFQAGDVLRIDTRAGQRSLTRLRGTTSSVALHALSVNSTWLMLRGGNNVLSGTSSSFMWGEVVYTPRYWGV